MFGRSVREWQTKLDQSSDFACSRQRRRQLAKQTVHLVRRLEVGLRAGSTANVEDGQIIVVLLGAPHNCFRAATFCHGLEDLVRERIACTREAHRVGGNQRQIEPLGKRNQATIDEFFARLTVVRQFDEEVWVRLVEPTRDCHRLRRIRRIHGLFDERREHADERPARQADQLTRAVLLQVPPTDSWPTKIRICQVRLV